MNLQVTLREEQKEKENGEKYSIFLNDLKQYIKHRLNCDVKNLAIVLDVSKNIFNKTMIQYYFIEDILTIIEASNIQLLTETPIEINVNTVGIGGIDLLKDPFLRSLVTTLDQIQKSTELTIKKMISQIVKNVFTKLVKFIPRGEFIYKTSLKLDIDVKPFDLICFEEQSSNNEFIIKGRKIGTFQDLDNIINEFLKVYEGETE